MIKLYSYPDLTRGTLIKRYKRFLADVRLGGGGKVTVFCPNSGSMLGLREPGIPVLLSPAHDPGRKTRWTLEAVKAGRVWVGVNTHLTNLLAGAIVERGLASGALKGLRIVRPEVTVGKSRLDYLLEDSRGRLTYMEVKSVTLRIGDEARFPDAVTARGAKHLHELSCIAGEGSAGAAMFYLVQRSDCMCFATADHIDPAYGRALRDALGAGVKAQVHVLSVRRDGVYYKGGMELCKSQPS